MPKRGDYVLYQQGGRSYNALVLAESTANADLLGAKGEPPLHLVVIFDDPPGKRIQIGELPEPTTLHDVVHASHKFDADYLHKYGASAQANRGAGEWRDAWGTKAAKKQ